MTKLADALKRRFTTPQAALRHLGLDASLLENGDTNMSLSRTAALAAVTALKRRGLIAQDASNEEAERVIHNSTETGDRTMRRMRMGDAEMQERQREEMCRDAMRRAADAADLDEEELKDVIEAIAQHAPQVLSEVQHEMAADNRGPMGWARDRAERRRAEDALRAKDAMRARKFGRVGRDDPPPFRGMPETGGSMVRDDERGEGYRTDRSWEENGIGTPEARDRRRGRAYDLALDSGDGNAAVAAWLGEQAASIGKL